MQGVGHHTTVNALVRGRGQQSAMHEKMMSTARQRLIQTWPVLKLLIPRTVNRQQSIRPGYRVSSFPGCFRGLDLRIGTVFYALCGSVHLTGLFPLSPRERTLVGLCLGGLPSSLECLGSCLVSSDGCFIGLTLYVLGQAVMCVLLFRVYTNKPQVCFWKGKVHVSYWQLTWDIWTSSLLQVSDLK